jgi:hypothetical protein
LNESLDESIGNSKQSDGLEFILFLVLILLFMGNNNTFSSYFTIFEDEIKYLNNIFKILTTTAEGLKGAFEAPKKVMKDLNFS